MSRGLGWIERAIIEVLDLNVGEFGKTGPELAHWITGATNSPSVRRALKRLEAKGVIGPLTDRYGRSTVWILTKAAKAETKRNRRREQDRTRRQKRKDEAHQEYQESRMARQHLQDRARDTARLEHLLGMLGSTHEGEVLNAARLAEKERRRLGKTWKEILAP